MFEIFNNYQSHEFIHLYIVTYIFIPFLAIYKFKIYSQSINHEFLSIKSTNQYRGICILVVILHHIAQRMDDPGLMGLFINAGPKAVSIFFFLSAYGLTSSLIANDRYLDGFINKKILRLYIPYILVNITVIILNYPFTNGTNSTEYLILSLFGFTTLTHLWFIKTIVLFYLFFWAAFRFSSEIFASILVTLCIFIYMFFCSELGLGPWWYESSLGFSLGIFFTIYKEKIITLIKNRYLFVITFLLILYSILRYGLSQKIPSLNIVLFDFIFMTIISKISMDSKILGFIGTISLEVYITHMILYRYFYLKTEPNNSNIYLYFISVILTSYILNKICRKIYKFNMKKMFYSKLFTARVS